MDYEKKYKELIEKIELISHSALTVEQHQIIDIILDIILGELKESEDERIRKALIDGFTVMKDSKNCGKTFSNHNIPVVDILAWLEKQEGCELIKKEWLEHIKQSWYKEGFIDGKYSGGTSKERTINDTTTLNELIDFLENGTAKLQHDLTRYANWLKIQFTPKKHLE